MRMLRIVRERRCEDARAPCFGSFRKGCDASLLDFQAQLCVLTVNPCRFSGDGARNWSVKKREFCGGRFRSRKYLRRSTYKQLGWTVYR